MRPWAHNPSWWRRALRVAPIVVANLIAATVPALHAASHHEEHRDHGPLPAHVSVDGEHHDVHPGGLHDNWRVQGRVGLDLPFVAPVRMALPEPSVELEIVLPVHFEAAESRAPPWANLARAPPTA